MFDKPEDIVRMELLREHLEISRQLVSKLTETVRHDCDDSILAHSFLSESSQYLNAVGTLEMYLTTDPVKDFPIRTVMDKFMINEYAMLHMEKDDQ